MSSETIQHLADVLDSRETVDNTAVFNYLLNVREKCWQMISQELSLREDMTCADIEHIPDLQGNIVGNMHTYTGDQSPVDWLLRSWIGKPETGFTNIHLTAWLNETVDVPHLGFALGTAPDVFFYCDLMPRYEIALHPEHMDKYHLSLNENWVKLRRDPDINVFNPVDMFTRSALSPAVLVGLVPFKVFTEKIERHLYDYVRYWIDLVKNAPPTPKETRPALKHRDHHVRKNIVERDPANILADRMLGVPMRERLVRILWGADRES